MTVGPNGVPDQILDTQIKRSIDSQLVAKGLTQVDGDKAELLVRYRVAVDRQKQWNATGMGDLFRSPGLGTAMRAPQPQPAQTLTSELSFSICTTLPRNSWFGQATQRKPSAPAKTRRKTREV